MALPNPVRKWLRYALDDLKVARALEPMGSSYWRACAYHSQQAAEKALKGYLAFHQIRFKKTHDVAELLVALESVDAKLAKKLAPAKKLTKYAIEYRYPDAANRLMTRAKARAAKLSAESLYNAIAEGLKKKARSGKSMDQDL